MELDKLKVLVIGPNVWGKGDTLTEALKKCHNPKTYIAYVCHEETYVSEDGSLCFRAGFRPKEIDRKKAKGGAA